MRILLYLAASSILGLRLPSAEFCFALLFVLVGVGTYIHLLTRRL